MIGCSVTPFTRAISGSGGPVPASYLFRDDWTTDDAAAVASPRTCEPGPGTWTITGTDQSIAGGVWIQPSIVANEGAYGESAGRVAGTALVYRRLRLANTSPGIAVFGFRGAASLGGTLLGGFLFQSGVFASNVSGNGAIAALPTVDVDYDYAVVLRATGCFLLRKLSSVAGWTLLYVEDCLTGTTNRPILYSNTGPYQCGPVQVFRPWTLPRLYYSASGVIGAVDPGQADFVAKMRCTGTGTQSLIFRRVDANNYWYIERAATTFRLFEYVAGVATQRATAAITAATGDRICVACDSTTIRLWHQVAAGGTIVTPTAYASATNFATATGMAVSDEANYSELEVFSRTQYEQVA